MADKLTKGYTCTIIIMKAYVYCVVLFSKLQLVVALILYLHVSLYQLLNIQNLSTLTALKVCLVPNLAE